MFVCLPFAFLTWRCSQAFKEQMATELREEKNPLDANLEKVLPGLHQWHNVNTKALGKVELAVNTLSSNLNQAVQGMYEQSREERKAADQRLAQALHQLASSYENGDEHPPQFVVTQQEQEQAEEEPSVGSDGIPNECEIRIAMKPKHQSLFGLWNEWHGLEEFADLCGGIKGREESYGSTWRKGIVNAQQFSRTKRIIEAIYKLAEEQSIQQIEAVATLEEAFVKESKCSVHSFVKYLKGKALITERPPRYKKKKADAQTVTTGDATSGES